MGRTIVQVKKSPEEQKAAFLQAFSECGNISRACRETHVPRQNVYDWFEADGAFKVAFDKLAPLALGVLEDEATRRAVEGTDKPVFYKGDIVGSIKEYSDTLMIVLLKARAPEKYKDRVSQEHTGKNGGPIDLSVDKLPQLSTDQLMNWLQSKKNG